MMITSELQRRNSEPIKSGLLDKGLRAMYRDARPGSLDDLSRSISQNYVTCQEILSSTGKQRDKLALSPDEGYGTDKTTSASPHGYSAENRPGKAAPTLSPVSTLNPWDGPSRGQTPTNQMTVTGSPMLMHRGTSLPAGSRSAVNKHGGVSAKRRDPMMESMDASLEDRLRALTTIEEEESGFGYSERKNTAPAFARNGSLRLPQEFVASQRLAQYNKLYFSERSNGPDLPDGYFRAEPVAVGADLQRHPGQGFSHRNSGADCRDGRNSLDIRNGASPDTEDGGWRDYTSYFQKDNDIPLHNIDPARRPKLTNISGEDIPDMEINRHIGTGPPGRHKNNSVLGLIRDDDTVGFSGINPINQGKYLALDDESCKTEEGQGIELQSDGLAFQYQRGRQSPCGQANGQLRDGQNSGPLRDVPETGQQMGSQYYGPLNGFHEIGNLRNSRGMGQQRSIQDFRQFTDSPDCAQFRDDQNFGQTVGHQDPRRSRVAQQGAESVSMGFHQNSRQNFVMSSMPDLTSREPAWRSYAGSESLQRPHYGHQIPHHPQQPQQSTQQYNHQKLVRQQLPQLYEQQEISRHGVEPQRHQNLPPQSNRYLNQHALYGSSMDVYDRGHSAYGCDVSDADDVVLRQSRQTTPASYPNRYSWQSGSLHDPMDRSTPTSTERSSLDLGNIPHLQRQIRATSELCLQASRRHMFASSADIYKLFSGQKKPQVLPTQSLAYEKPNGKAEKHSLGSLPSDLWSPYNPAKSEPIHASPRVKPRLRVVMPPSSLSSLPSPGPVRADHTINVPTAAWTSDSPVPTTSRSDEDSVVHHRSGHVMSAHADIERYNFPRPSSAVTDYERPMFQRQSSGYSSETELQQIEFNAKAIKKLQQHQQLQYFQGAPQEFLPLNRSIDRESNNGADPADNEPVYVNQLALSRDRPIDADYQTLPEDRFSATAVSSPSDGYNHEKMFTSDWKLQQPNPMAASKLNPQVIHSVNTENMGFNGIVQKQVINFSSRPVTIISHIPPRHTPSPQSPFNHLPASDTPSSHNHISSGLTHSSHSSNYRPPSSQTSTNNKSSHHTPPSNSTTLHITSNISSHMPSSHIPSSHPSSSHVSSNPSSSYKMFSHTSATHPSSIHTSPQPTTCGHSPSGQAVSSYRPFSRQSSHQISPSQPSSGINNKPSDSFVFQEVNNDIQPAAQSTTPITNTTSIKAQYLNTVTGYPPQPKGTNVSFPDEMFSKISDKSSLFRQHRPTSSRSVQLSPVKIAQILDTPFETNIISDEQGDRLSTLV